jgi:hypothetical protein
MKILQLIALLSSSSALAFAQVSVFESAPGLPGSVVVVATSEFRPSELQGITLLPLDCTARTRLTELMEGNARLRSDVPGASRLLLPGERGSLYKYSRVGLGGRATFGFFLVRPVGIATPLFELGGTGIAGTDDPFPENLAVAVDGRSFLVASNVAAGGDLWEINLVGTAINRTSNLPPLNFGKNGLALLGTWGLGVAANGVYRFDRVLGGVASVVSLPISPLWFGPDVVRSADESTVAFLAGADGTHVRVLTCHRTGGSVPASDSAMNIPGAGFLPEDPTGPALALSTDGSWVAWRVEGSSRECFVRETRPGPRAPSQLLTGPTAFSNTLNDTGVIAYIDRDSAVLVAGRERSDGIGRGDLYRIDLASPSGFTATNLTRTSGIIQPPFDYGTLSTGDGLFQVPGPSPAFVMLDGDGAGRMLWTEAAGGTVAFLARVQSLDSLDVTGSFLVAGVTRPPGVDDPLTESLNLIQIPRGGLGATVARLPNGCHLSRTVGSRSRNLFASVLEFPSGERLGRLRVPSTSGISISPSLLTFGPTTGMSAEGAILATVEVARSRAAFSWSDMGTSVLKVSQVETILLPGL